jgi:hypothetical protein
MGEKASHRQAREAVAAYHLAALSELAQHVVDAANKFRAGTLDVTAFDRVIHQYHRASQELWTFCNLGDPRATVDLIDKGVPIDWWGRGAPKRA